MASAEANDIEAAEAFCFTVERVRIDEAGGHCLISGADDEEEPAGYFIVEIDVSGITLEFLGEELSQSDGVLALTIAEHLLDFTLELTSKIGGQMPRVRVTSREPIGTAARAALKRAFGDRVSEA